MFFDGGFGESVSSTEKFIFIFFNNSFSSFANHEPHGYMEEFLTALPEKGHRENNYILPRLYDLNFVPS